MKRLLALILLLGLGSGSLQPVSLAETESSAAAAADPVPPSLPDGVVEVALPPPSEAIDKLVLKLKDGVLLEVPPPETLPPEYLTLTPEGKVLFLQRREMFLKALAVSAYQVRTLTGLACYGKAAACRLWDRIRGNELQPKKNMHDMAVETFGTLVKAADAQIWPRAKAFAEGDEARVFIGAGGIAILAAGDQGGRMMGVIKKIASPIPIIGPKIQQTEQTSVGLGLGVSAGLTFGYSFKTHEGRTGVAANLEWLKDVRGAMVGVVGRGIVGLNMGPTEKRTPWFPIGTTTYLPGGPVAVYDGPGTVGAELQPGLALGVGFALLQTYRCCRPQLVDANITGIFPFVNGLGGIVGEPVQRLIINPIVAATRAIRNRCGESAAKLAPPTEGKSEGLEFDPRTGTFIHPPGQ